MLTKERISCAILLASGLNSESAVRGNLSCEWRLVVELISSGPSQTPVSSSWMSTTCSAGGTETIISTLVLHYSGQVSAAVSVKTPTRQVRDTKPDLASVSSDPHCLQRNVDKRSVKKPETCSSIGSVSIHVRSQLILWRVYATLQSLRHSSL
jgi:hypothetical protein